ncbi:MAG: PAS domain S-box protein [Desulfobacterales bacterium]|jgi:polar amino acid transport system substrate-binding protein
MIRFLSKDFRIDPPSSQYGSIQKPGILIILAGCFIALVVVLAWFALDRVEEKIQADVGDALQIVLQTTQESLNLWVESNKFQLTRLAEHPRLVHLAERQLSVLRNKNALLKSDALQLLRAFFRYGRDQFGEARFFIISPDLINIASMRDENIGAKNLIANQALDLLNRTFEGQTVMVPPIWSNIPLITTQNGKNKKSAAMFFVAPIKNMQERVIAVIAQQVDPSIDFTRLIQLGRLGKSGETYAFGQYGKLLSESRFGEDLVKAELIREGETSILTVSVRDPGGDMTKGFTPSIPRYQQPLTLMARQATQGKAGLNVKGYRDYRGVPVYGAWLWDDTLGIGLSNEIDEADALGPYYTTRTVILTVLGITVLLALGSLVFAVLIDVRANRTLQKSYDELELRVEERTAELKENQARLAQEEERSRLLLESAEEGIFGVAEDGLVNFINPAGLKMLGFTTEEVIGQKIHPLIHHTRHDGTPYPIEECPMYHSLTQGVSGRRDDEVLWRKDGTSFSVEYTSVPIRKNGSIAGTVVVFRDISERKRAEDAIRESQERLRISQQTLKIALESSNTGVWTFDPQTNETTFQSEQWYKQIGYQRDEFKADQDPFADLLHPDDKAATFKAIEHHLEGVTKTYEKEFRLKSKDGTWSWILSKGQITKRDSDGKATEMTGVHLDITERRHMEDELRQKVDELERFSKVAFGREKKMIQLKQEINELMIQLGKVEKYKIAS